MCFLQAMSAISKRVQFLNNLNTGDAVVVRKRLVGTKNPNPIYK
jgi:hypothetical protein